MHSKLINTKDRASIILPHEKFFEKIQILSTFERVVLDHSVSMFVILFIPLIPSLNLSFDHGLFLLQSREKNYRLSKVLPQMDFFTYLYI